MQNNQQIKEHDRGITELQKNDLESTEIRNQGKEYSETRQQSTKHIEELAAMAVTQMLTYPVLTSSEKVKKMIKTYLLRRTSCMPDRFFWSHGMLAQGLETWMQVAGQIRNSAAMSDGTYTESLERYYDNWIQKGARINYVDTILNGYTLVGLYQQTGKVSYQRALEKMYQYLLDYPKDREGNIAYRLHHPTHIYADGLGMVCPFLSRFGKEFKREEAVTLSMTQLTNFLNYGMDAKSGLPYHGYDTATHQKLGIIGWGRAVGWLLLGLCDSLEYMEQLFKDHEQFMNGNEHYVKDYEFCVEALGKLAASMEHYQLETGYFTWQLGAMEGPIDTSATAMIGYALLKGRTLGILPDSCQTVIEKAHEAIQASVKDGQIGDCLAECEGFSQHPQVYGAYPWSLGPGLRMLALYEEAAGSKLTSSN